MQATHTNHAHLSDRTQRTGNLVQIQLMTAHPPTIVLAYDSKADKDVTVRQIKSLKFQCRDCDHIKLDVQDFSDNLAGAEDI